MEHGFRVRPLAEGDLDGVIVGAGGRRAHPDADRRKERGADYVLGDAVIELKMLDEEGFDKRERQGKLAGLFQEIEASRPVIVLDRKKLTHKKQRTYDNILNGPVKGAIRSARGQLAQTRLEYPATRASVLWVVNNGYTALDHGELTHMVADRVRNTTQEIDGVVISGCYFHTDGFDSYFFWPMTYVPINISGPFAFFDCLHTAWQEFSGEFMSKVMTGDMPVDPSKNPVMDLEFDVDGITYIKPAPPIGAESSFYRHGRPRENSSGLETCPPVAVTLPYMTRSEWHRFRNELLCEEILLSTYEDWQRHHQRALESGMPLRPVVSMDVTFEGWAHWCNTTNTPEDIQSVRDYANQLFNDAAQSRIAAARERFKAQIIPARYVLAQTEEIGQDCANDVSHIMIVTAWPNDGRTERSLAHNVRIFHPYALALATAYAVKEQIECVLWEKDRQYAWY